MGRPRVHEPDTRVATALRIPRDLHERIKAEAARRCIGANLLLTAIIDQGLPEFEQEEMP